jgi:DNA-binding HxlR family transcriptional regulator
MRATRPRPDVPAFTPDSDVTDAACPAGFLCPVDVTLSVIGGKWKVLIYDQLRRGVTRFGQLKRALPRITQTMLTQQLRELERDGIVTRTVFAEVPPRVEYALTDFGRTLECVILVMCQWGTQYQAMVVEQKRAAGRALELPDTPAS